MPILKNWSVYINCLIGEVHEDPRFNPGERIITTPIRNLDFDKMLGHTQNQTYRLGEPSKPEGKIFARPALKAVS